MAMAMVGFVGCGDGGDGGNGDGAFRSSDVENVYFKGEASEELKDVFFSRTKFFYYSENPNYDGYHWYYQGDVPTIWS